MDNFPIVLHRVRLHLSKQPKASCLISANPSDTKSKIFRRLLYGSGSSGTILTRTRLCFVIYTRFRLHAPHEIETNLPPNSSGKQSLCPIRALCVLCVKKAQALPPYFLDKTFLPPQDRLNETLILDVRILNERKKQFLLELLERGGREGRGANSKLYCLTITSITT
ncbi:hypothetical protein KFK09_024140 [Dendrobium nobile]|uniref:Uncharacterized protein n=1 Tax=Dendrobium nobile TaxID=94219 RepID=A0A8T3AD13_DENNO|nr:hypothetical protein KFK09_024140 [Dendrobium nobile]